MADDIHTVVLTGRLARDPELRHTAGGTAVLKMRLAYTSTTKASGSWEDKSNFIDVVTFGNRAEALAKFLAKGSAVAVSGRIEWREWEAQDKSKRQSYEVIADTFKLLGKKDDNSSGGGPSSSGSSGGDSDFVPAGASSDGSGGGYSDSGGDSGFGGVDDDIPF